MASSRTGALAGRPSIFVAIGAAIMLVYPLAEQRFQEMVSEVALWRADPTGAVGEGSAA